MADRSRWSWSCQFVKINEVVFVLPRYINKYLAEATCTWEFKSVTAARTLLPTQDGVCQLTTCIVGKIECFKKESISVRFRLVDLNDDLSFLNVRLSGRCLAQLVNPGNAMLFLKGGELQYDSERSPIVDGNDSTEALCCVFVSESFYKKLLKWPPVTLVYSIACMYTNVSCSDIMLPVGQRPAATCSVKENLITPKCKCTEFVHEYCKIKEIREGNIVNVAGCVTFFKHCQATKSGSGYFRTFYMVDPSVFPQEITVVAFANSVHELPLIYRVGDIIVLKNVEVKLFAGSLQITCNYYSSFQIFGCFMDELVQPYFQSRNFVSFANVMLVCMLRKWASCVSLSSINKSCKLCQVIPGLQFDLVCKLIDVRHDSTSILLFVSDGTKPLVSTDCCNENNYVQTVTVQNIPLQFIQNGQFLYLHNVHARPVCENRIKFVIEVDQRGICFSTLPFTDFDVCTIKDHLCGLALVPPSVTTHPYNHCKFTAISDILLCSKVPNTYRINAIAVSIGLLAVEECVRLICYHCHKKYEIPKSYILALPTVNKPGSKCCNCSKASVMYSYVVPLKVKDNTGSMTIFLAYQWAEKFFKDIPPTNLYLDSTSKNNVLQCLKTVFGRNPFEPSPPCSKEPWLDCHICSYYVHHNRETGSRPLVQYQITDTTLSMSTSQI